VKATKAALSVLEKSPQFVHELPCIIGPVRQFYDATRAVRARHDR
jgi:hypothetical protein